MNDIDIPMGDVKQVYDICGNKFTGFICLDCQKKFGCREKSGYRKKSDCGKYKIIYTITTKELDE